jgi:hypothetical protein
MALPGCKDKNSNDSDNTPKAASLSFVRPSYDEGSNGKLLSAKAQATSVGEEMVSATVAYNVGFIDSTTTYLFMLKNTGNLPATNIQLTSDNPAVRISPGTIGVLEPEGVSSLAPIIKVTVQHGLNASGIGSTALLSRGELVISMTASGSQGAFTSTTIGGYVRVADMRMIEGSPANTLYEWTLPGGRSLRSQNSSTPTLWENLGNSPVTVERYGLNADSTLYALDTITVDPNETYRPLDDIDTWNPDNGIYWILYNFNTNGVQALDGRAEKAFHEADATTPGPESVAN